MENLFVMGTDTAKDTIEKLTENAEIGENKILKTKENNMPGFDRTGPIGEGSQTGRGMGLCNPETKDYVKNALEDEAQIAQVRGRGMRRGRGGRGKGRGGGRGMGRGIGRAFAKNNFQERNVNENQQSTTENAENEE